MSGVESRLFEFGVCLLFGACLPVRAAPVCVLSHSTGMRRQVICNFQLVWVRYYPTFVVPPPRYSFINLLSFAGVNPVLAGPRSRSSPSTGPSPFDIRMNLCYLHLFTT